MTINPIVLLTDFGLMDGFIGVMKGVIAGIHPSATVIDLSHDIPPQQIDDGRFVIWNSYRFFPAGTIFVCVIDPGVGSSRKIVAVKTRDYYFVAPDNGLLDYVLNEETDWICREVTNPTIFRREISNTFHGRDIFAPIGAHLSKGFSFDDLGPEYKIEISANPFIHVDRAGEWHGRIIYHDRFGNMISNLKMGKDFADYQGEVKMGETAIPFKKTYAEVKEGDLLALVASHGLLEIACRNGNASEILTEKEFSLRLF